MKTIQIFKLVILAVAMLLTVVGVDYVPHLIAWLPSIGAAWWVLSDKVLMERWNKLMDDLGA